MIYVNTHHHVTESNGIRIDEIETTRTDDHHPEIELTRLLVDQLRRFDRTTIAGESPDFE